MRRVFRRALRDVVVFTAVLALVGAGVGWLVDGTPGVWSGVLGAAVSLLVAGTTVATMLVTSGADLARAGAVALAAWVVKAMILIGAFIALRGSDLVNRPIFSLVVVAGVLGSLALDYRAVARGRVPYVDPPPGARGADEGRSAGP
jgi:stage V sporulation protein SpoVS